MCLNLAKRWPHLVAYHLSLLTVFSWPSQPKTLSWQPCEISVLDQKRSELCYTAVPRSSKRSTQHVALCEANDPGGGIARHKHVARDHAMLGMVVHAELTEGAELNLHYAHQLASDPNCSCLENPNNPYKVGIPSYKPIH